MKGEEKLQNHSMSPIDLPMWFMGGGVSNYCPVPIFESILNCVYIKGCQEIEYLREKNLTNAQFSSELPIYF